MQDLSRELIVEIHKCKDQLTYMDFLLRKAWFQLTLIKTDFSLIKPVLEEIEKVVRK